MVESGTEIDTEKFSRFASMRDQFAEYWSFITGGVSSVSTPILAAQNTAEFDITSNVLTIAALEYQGQYFSLSFNLTKIEPLEFVLDNFAQLSDSPTVEAATVSGVTILVPELLVVSDRYQIELEIVNDNPVTVRLTSAELL